MARDKSIAKDAVARVGTIGVFISWSGETSRTIAEELSLLIPNIFQDVTAFVSSNDIDAGSNWFGRISAELAETEFGIVCLTPENLSKQWIHFEAGALAKRLTDRTRVVPYLHGITMSDLSPPLSLFYGVTANKSGTLSLLKSLNSVRPHPFELSKWHASYEKWGPEFEQKLANLPISGPPAVPRRSERDLLEEVLARLKGSQETEGEMLGIKPARPAIQNLDEFRLNKKNLQAQLLLKIADLKMMSLKESEAYKRLPYEEVVSLLQSHIRNIEHSPPY